MTVLKSSKAKILRLNSSGNGIFIDDKKEQEIPCVLPEEIIKFELHSYRNKKNYILTEIIEKSKYRVDPQCKYFSVCGGCQLQHLSPDYYSSFKQKIIADKISKCFPNCDIKNLIIIEKGSRRRIRLAFVKKKANVFLGFKKYKSDKIVNIDSCIASTPGISNFLNPLKKFLSFVASEGEGTIHITEAENGIDALIEYDFSTVDTEILNESAAEFCQNSNVIQLSFKKKNGTITILYKKDQPFVILGGAKVNISASGFLQSTKLSDSILPKNVLSLITTPKGSNILDLFCGRGTFSLYLADLYCIRAIDGDKDAVQELANAAALYKKNVKVQCKDLFTNPIQSKEIVLYSTIIINPPRSGASKQVSELAKGSADIIYVSCNIETFLKDALILKKNSYNLTTVIPIDQFYWSSCIEIVAKFNKK